MSTNLVSIASSPQLDGLRIAFAGKLGGVTRREAAQLVKQHGGLPLERPDETADWIVIGADELPISEPDDLLEDDVCEAAAAGRLEILSETQFWQRLGLVEGEQNVRRLYTPSMLSDLLKISIATVRRWHRKGLIVPAREVHRLPYFDFQEVASAKHLAQLLANGASVPVIEKRLAELSRYVPEIERPLAQLSIIVEGKRLLLRRGEGLVEPGGQMLIDFDALDQDQATGAMVRPTVSLEDVLLQNEEVTPAELLESAAQLEDEGYLDAAVDMYRAYLASVGPSAQINFQLAELLYRLGEVTAARERYFMTIEIDEDYVEARANLGCVLAETGQLELAVAAFHGALHFHDDYPDVHYHLARALDDLLRADDAEYHWHRFLQLAPNSPWADEAQLRLAAVEPSLKE